MKKFVVVLSLVICSLGMVSGCQRVRPAEGGTRGTLRNATTELRDVRIDVYPAGALEPIGFGLTTNGGNFELFQSEARGPLHLEPGDYSFTFESMGPEPLALAPELRDPQRTPIRKHWHATNSVLLLTLP